MLKSLFYLAGTLFFVFAALVYRETKIPLFTVVDIPLAETAGQGSVLNILHLADLHGDVFGERQKRIQEMISAIKVDMLVLTGDLVDEKTTSFGPVKDFLDILPKAPTFFVPGNHDKISPVAEELFHTLSRRGIRILENQMETIDLNGQCLYIVGIDDPYLGRPDFSLLSQAKPKGISASILLSHSPTLGSASAFLARRKNALPFSPRIQRPFKKSTNDARSILHVAAKNGFDLVLTGHTHGGQVALPFLGAVFVPGQSFPPKYVKGLYKEKETSMFITRGLGTSRIPMRFFSRPEVALIRIRLPQL